MCDWCINSSGVLAQFLCCLEAPTAMLCALSLWTFAYCFQVWDIVWHLKGVQNQQLRDFSLRFQESLSNPSESLDKTQIWATKSLKVNIIIKCLFCMFHFNFIIDLSIKLQILTFNIQTYTYIICYYMIINYFIINLK